MATLAVLEQSIVDQIRSLNRTTHSTALKRWLNEAVRDVLIRTGVKVTSSTVSLTAGTADYTLDAAAMRIKAATFDGDPDRPLRQVSPAEIDEMRARGDATASDSDDVWYYALSGTDLFMIYPTPSATGTINLRVVQKPTEMSSDAHDPSNATYGGIPVEHHRALEMYGLWRAAQYDRTEAFRYGELFREQYERELTLIRGVVNLKGGTTLPRGRVGRSRYLPSDPSADFR